MIQGSTDNKTDNGAFDCWFNYTDKESGKIHGVHEKIKAMGPTGFDNFYPFVLNWFEGEGINPGKHNTHKDNMRQVKSANLRDTREGVWKINFTNGKLIIDFLWETP